VRDISTKVTIWDGATGRLDRILRDHGVPVRRITPLTIPGRLLRALDKRTMRREAARHLSELQIHIPSIGQAVEKARQEKLIGNALEAAVILRCDQSIIAEISKEELEEFFILSDLTIEDSVETEASISKTSFRKCARCWRHRPSVGASVAHPELCDRCEQVVANSGNVAK
jgi:isoleucyl-tRNA synthetase